VLCAAHNAAGKKTDGSNLLTAVEEHISDDGMFLVDLEWMTTQHNTLGNNTIRIN